MTGDLRDVVDVRVLTPTQEGMLYHSLSSPDSDVYHSQVVSTLPPDLDVERFQRSWETLVDRHETLRTGFFWDGLDQPLQVVMPEAELRWEVSDWTRRDAHEVDDGLTRLLERDGFVSFPLDEAPLARMRLIRRPDRHWTWVWTFHHMILDGWSVRILMRELSELYRGSPSSLAEPVSPRTYLDWLAGQDPQRSLQHWSERLADVTGAQHLELPGLPAGGRGHDRLDTTVPSALVERMARTAAALRVTPSALVTAAWSLVVSSMTTGPDVVVGVTTSGRPPQLAGVEHLVGLFLNTLPLATAVEHGTTVGEYVTEVHRSQLDLVEHEHVGLAEVHRLAGIRGGESLFESIVVFENLPPERGSGGVGPFDDLDFRERSNFPLALLATPGEQLALRLVFDTARFSQEAAGLLLRMTTRALEQLTVADLELSQLRLAGDDDAELVGPAAAAATRTVVDEIADVARTRAGDTALATATDEVTYGEMWERVEQLAGRLAAGGLGRGDRVGVMVPRSTDMIVAILGVLRSGAAYVPLDPAYPRAHLEQIVDGAGVSAVVVDGSVTDPPQAGQVIDVAGSAGDLGPLPEGPLLEDVAYVIHTSGSTGRPKGVVVSHANLASSTGSRTDHYGAPVGSFLLLSSASFDSSVAGIFWTLTTGGCLVLPDDGGEKDLAHLRRLLERRAVTHTLALPSLHRILAEEGGPLPDTLDCVIVAGEAVDRDVVDAHFRATDARLFNEYGPTEGTVWATVAELRPDDEVGSIGRPIPGTRVRVVDHLGNPVPRGFAGELTISGPGVVDGYSDDEDATATSFEERDGRRWYRTGDRCVVDVEGHVVFLGRTDEQLKVRGHRIEPAGVEAALRASAGVADAAVRATTRHGATILVGYVVGDVDVAALEAHLTDRLPRHMVPGALVTLDRLPRLPNGKVDHGALPEPGPRDGMTELVEPSSDAERVLARIWAELLGHDDFGVLDDFFAIGGDSLQTIQMVSRARQAGLDVDMRVLLTDPTIRALASDLDRTDDRSVPRSMTSLVEIQRGDARNPLVAVHAGGGHVFLYRELAQHLGESQTVYGLEPIGLDGTETPIESIPEMAERYVHELREVQPEGPYRFVGYCMGGAVSLEMTRQLEDQGDEVEFIVVVDSGLPSRPQRVTPTAKIRAELASGGVPGLASFLSRRLVVRLRRARDRLTGGQVGRDRVTLELVQRACRRAFQSYRARPVRAPISLIRSSEFAAAPEKSYHMRWGEVTPRLTTSVVEGRHKTILDEPTVGAVADLIRSELQQHVR